MEDILIAARRGDQDAFEAVIGPLIEPAHRLATGMLGDPQAAEDAVQEAMVKAWRKLHRHRPGAKLHPWFFAIVANQCRDSLRSRWRNVIPLVGGASAPGMEADASRHVDVVRALTGLRHRDREAVVLHFYLDLTIGEVAAVLGSSPSATKSRIYRALKTLRPALELADSIR
jgi:RNA polymerase sigma-70 factor (ECF subfamily)